jgi:general secretion pathway protein M
MRSLRIGTTEISDKRKVLSRLSVIATEAANVRSIASDTSAQMRSGEILAGANENVVGADLQTRLKAIWGAVARRAGLAGEDQ